MTGSEAGPVLGPVARLVTRTRSRDEWLSCELRQILDALPTLVFIADDVECRSIYGNRAAERLFRLAPGGNFSKTAPEADVPRGFSFFDVDGREIAPENLPVQRALRGEIIENYESEVRFPDGQGVWLLGNAIPLRDDGGAIWGAVSAFIDITIRKRAESANAAKSRLLAAASHDLRQPVHGMSLMLAALQASRPDKSGAIIAKLETCLSMLMDQLTSLLDLAKADSGRVAVHFQTCRLRDIIERAMEPFVPLAIEKGVGVRVCAIGAVVRTDPTLLERILTNLVSNAIKYTPPGGRVLIGCRRRGPHFSIDVIDTGIGIKPDQLASIWSEFYRVDDTQGRGVGLGLAIVDKTAQLLGSRVTVKSAPGKGSVFSVTVNGS